MQVIQSQGFTICLSSQGLANIQKQLSIAAIYCLFLFTPISQAVTATEIKNLSVLTNPQLISNNLLTPWGMAFIDEKTLLVTEKMGTIKLIRLPSFLVNSNHDKTTIKNKILTQSSSLSLFTKKQGGLLDIAISPNFKHNLRIYITYSQAIKLENNKIVAATTLATATLSENPVLQTKTESIHISPWKQLITSNVQTTTARHFGSRIAFDNNNHLFISMGDRGNRDNGQDLTSLAGVILRLNLDGSIPPNNPFTTIQNARPSIYSYGHRNPQGLAFDSHTQQLIASEHGPRGGDEINIIQAGRNYGWPTVSHGKEYWGPLAVGKAQSLPEYTDPVAVYIPSIGTSGISLQNQTLYIGGLAKPQISHILLKDLYKAAHQTHRTPLKTPKTALLSSLKQRIRDIETSPDQKLYFITDSGNLYRLNPKEAKP